MSDSFVINGLVLSQSRHTDFNKFISVLTQERGLISVYCYGAMNLRNRNFAGTQPYSFSELEISRKGDMYILKDASVIKYFCLQSGSLLSNALLMYTSELLSFVCMENEDETSMLRLALNTFYAISSGTRDIPLIKAAFELRAASLLGFAPDLSGSCVLCSESHASIFDFESGGLICRSCFNNKPDKRLALELDGSTLAAIRYVLTSDERRFLSFSIDDDLKRLFSTVSESYLLYHLDRSFESLKFYKSVL